MAKLDQEYDELMSKNSGPKDIQEYFMISSQILELNFYLHSHILSSIGGSNGGALSHGRICFVSKANNGYVNAPAIVLRSPTLILPDPIHKAVCLVLLPLSYIPGQITEGTQHLRSLHFEEAIRILIIYLTSIRGSIDIKLHRYLKQ